MGRGAALAAADIVLGLAASLMLSELLASMLFGVRPTGIDPLEVLREG
ncbi:MAG TPA: hypothetical protein VK399_08220 [Longimicrobiaceae bacterium]|nr:hypothetical protein [Longimicrobiaceae bacterium]